MIRQVTIAITFCALSIGLRAAETQHPKDIPVKLEGDKRAEIEKRMAPYVRLAKRTFPEANARFKKGLPTDHTFYVVTRLHDQTGEFEQVFVTVTSIDGGTINGTVASDTAGIKEFAKGDKVQITLDDLIDWTIVDKNGQEEGNVVGKFLDAYNSRYVALIIAVKLNAKGIITEVSFKTALTTNNHQNVGFLIPDETRRQAERKLKNMDPDEYSVILVKSEAGLGALIMYDMHNHSLVELEKKSANKAIDNNTK